VKIGWLLAPLLMLVAALFSVPALAQSFATSPEEHGLLGLFDEARIGTIYSLDPADESGVLVSGSLYFRGFRKPSGHYLSDTLLNPRLFVGGNVATGSDGIDQVFAGLAWKFPVANIAFLEATLGGTVHDGRIELTGDGPYLGCRALFRESGALGLNLGPDWEVIAQLDHSSNAGLCQGNSGITHAGVYVGYRF
jgi:hypothetical protein